MRFARFKQAVGYHSSPNLTVYKIGDNTTIYRVTNCSLSFFGQKIALISVDPRLQILTETRRLLICVMSRTASFNHRLCENACEFLPVDPRMLKTIHLDTPHAKRSSWKLDFIGIYHFSSCFVFSANSIIRAVNQVHSPRKQGYSTCQEESGRE